MFITRLFYPVTRKKIIWFSVIVVALVGYYFCLPSSVFRAQYSTVLLDAEGNLLNASIAPDGQWRFPVQQQVPEKFQQAIVLFEDKRFFSHPGIDVMAMGRAIRQNIASGKVVSGGSTLSMQVIRLSKGVTKRTFFNKVLEIIQATRLELRFSKNEIMALYASHAPFGGNVVGIEAACWRYFGRQPDNLSWAEAATLAVLPNNPSMMHPGKNRVALLAKRDRLLARIHQAGLMDDVAFDLSLAEPIPDQPMALPRLAPHLMDRASEEVKGEKRIATTLDLALQERATQILNQHHNRLKGNQIFNAAAIIMEVNSGKVLAYVGNVHSGREHQEQVDVIRARRSTGSILKPFLYAAMMNEGKLLPQSLVPDVPTMINGFAPSNFSKSFDGAVPADKALIRSLNIPAVHELRELRYEKFYRLLKEIGLTTLDQPADHYGLSLILGGAEATLWDITGAYASMARTLNTYFTVAGTKRYTNATYHSPCYMCGDSSVVQPAYEAQTILDAGSIWLTFEALKEVYRPGEETGWQNFYSARQIAWKTGTSFGFRDGWAVGVTPDYAVGVWVGNADGEGRPHLTGTETAAPILFDLFSVLPARTWFDVPRSDLQEVEVCAISGNLASEWCDKKTLTKISVNGLKTKPCANHHRIHLAADNKSWVHATCASLSDIHAENWFILPPVQEFYYKAQHLSYRSLPPFRKDCVDPAAIVAMDVVYPKTDSKIFVPRLLDGAPGRTIFQVAHRNPAAVVYWHLDGQFVGTTRNSHRLPFSPADGRHRITLVDDQGETIDKYFEVISAR